MPLLAHGVELLGGEVPSLVSLTLWCESQPLLCPHPKQHGGLPNRLFRDNIFCFLKNHKELYRIIVILMSFYLFLRILVRRAVRESANENTPALCAERRNNNKKSRRDSIFPRRRSGDIADRCTHLFDGNS